MVRTTDLKTIVVFHSNFNLRFMAESKDGFLTVERPQDAQRGADFYILVKAAKISKLYDILLDDDHDNLESVPGKAYYRLAGFQGDWCDADDAGSGSGNGSGYGSGDDYMSDDVDIEVGDIMEFSGEVTVSHGSRDASEYDYFYCYSPIDENDEC